MVRLGCTLVLSFAAIATATAAELELDFSKMPVGASPRGFRSAVPGGGKPGDWRIVQDVVPPVEKRFSPGDNVSDRRPVLAQTSRDTTGESRDVERFPVLLREGEAFGDFTFTTRFKLVSGEKEQMAGIVFRAQDEKNFYCLRASGLGNTIRFLVFTNGDYIPDVVTNTPVAAGVWHTLGVECRGTQIRCFFNGQQVFPDMFNAKFAAGTVGFWTKSDAVSHFADARILYTPREPLAQVIVREVLRDNPRLVGLKVFAPVRAGSDDVRLIASNDESELGRAAEQLECDVIAKDVILFGRGNKFVQVTMPVHDRNGEAIAAVRVVLTDFAGQSEMGAINRARPLVKLMEDRMRASRNIAAP
jgi:hypothetical protein